MIKKEAHIFNMLTGLLVLLILWIPETSYAAIPTVISSSKNNLSSLAPILEKVLPTVVNIHVTGTQIQNQKIPEEFKFFFGPNFPSQQRNFRHFEGASSGIIIDSENGYIITNHHVIKHANKIYVQLSNGKEINGKVIGSDPLTDIALIQIKSSNQKNLKQFRLKSIKFSDSDQLRIGDFVIAIGNPFGIGQTVTSGIISALGRSINSNALENFIQTDAPINKGNSGGALINLSGELIGINTAILSPGGGNIGIGFAIPSNIAKSISNQIIKNRKIKRGVLGIKAVEMTSDLAKSLNIELKLGAFVKEIIPNSPAFQAGIQPGDILISINNKQVNSFSEFKSKIGTTDIGKKITIGVLRKGKLIKVNVALKEKEKKSTIKKLKISTTLISATKTLQSLS